MTDLCEGRPLLAEVLIAQLARPVCPWSFVRLQYLCDNDARSATVDRPSRRFQLTSGRQGHALLSAIEEESLFRAAQIAISAVTEAYRVELGLHRRVEHSCRRSEPFSWVVVLVVVVVDLRRTQKAIAERQRDGAREIPTTALRTGTFDSRPENRLA